MKDKTNKDVPPNIEVSNCWASCCLLPDEPIDLMFDVLDKRTGISYENLSAIFANGKIVGVFDPSGDNLMKGSSETAHSGGVYITFDPEVKEPFYQALCQQLIYWCKTLFAASACAARMVEGFDEFSRDFEARDYGDAPDAFELPDPEN
jgi:hypothetical protein